MTVYIVKIKIHENITEQFSYVEPKSYDMPGKNLVFAENWRYVRKNFCIPGKITICALLQFTARNI
jgi:hypothetical protein